MSVKNIDQFWAWSLKHYARDGVEPTLLKLQEDFNANINILLWACWSAENFAQIPDLVIRKSIDQTFALNHNITQRLRGARKFLKNWQSAVPNDDAEQLREKIKDAELCAEKVEQLLLQDLATTHLTELGTGDRHGATARALHNLTAYFAISGVSRRNDFSSSLLQTLIDHIFDPNDLASIRPAAKADNKGI